MIDKAAIYHKALDTYGAEAQTLMCMEEMAELQKEQCKHARGADNRAALAEEIADVRIVLDQMELLHECESLAADYEQVKILRLEKRMEGKR